MARIHCCISRTGRILSILVLLGALWLPAAVRAGEMESKEYTMTNNSSEDANDMHAAFKNSRGDEANLDYGSSEAFSDPPKRHWGTLDWPKEGGGGSVPAGKKDTFAARGPKDDFFMNEAWFTNGGRKLDSSKPNVSTGWEHSGPGMNLQITNSEAFPMILTDLRVYKDNDLANLRMDDLTIPFANPTGSLILQLSNQVLQPGQTMTLPLGPLDIDTHYPLALATVAPMSDPADTYPMADAINNEPDVPEPATLLAMLAGIGSLGGYLRRRRWG